MSANTHRQTLSYGAKTRAKRLRRAARAESRHLLRFERLEERAMMAAPQEFEPRGAGGGGALFAPSFSPFDANDLYIASDMSQLFHTTNLGQSWETVTYREIQGNTGAQVQFTNDPAIRYALDYTSLLMNAVTPSKSTDGGVTWTRLTADPTGAEAYSLYADPADHNRLLVSNYTQLFFSSNGGASFGAAKYTTTDTGAGLHIAGAFFDGANIYVGTNKGLLVSGNGGSTFSLSSVGGIPADDAIVSFAGSKEGGQVRLFAVTMDVGDVYAGVPGSDYFGYQGIYSLDVGQTSWTLRTTGIDAAAKPHFVALARNEIDVAYVAGSNESGVPTVYKTTNGGISWQSVLLTTNNQNVATGWSGHNGDRGWTYGENAMGFAVAPTDPNRLVITDFGFAHVSTNGGTSWSQMYVNPADQNPAGAATPKGRSYRSTGLDNTTSWGITWVTPSKLIGSNSDIRGVRSDDGGQSWSFNYTGHTDNSMYRAVVHPQTGVVYAGTSSVHDLYQSTRLQDSILDPGTGKLLFSTNQGSTWQTLHDFGDPVVWVTLDPNNPNRMYASVVHSSNGGIYVSNNIPNGAASTWTRLATPPRSEGHPFNIHVLADGTLVATYSGRRNSSGAFTASSGVFVSTNGGSSWIDRSDPGMRYWTKDITIDPHDPSQNTWYVGVFSGFGGPPNGLGGLYRSTNRGQSWTRINSLDRVTSLTISPTNPSEAYLTTEEDGLWHTENLNAATPTFTQLAQYPFKQPERVFFNPFNANEIWVTSFGNGMRVGTVNAATPGTLAFSTATYSVGEAGGQALITVNRTGGSSGAVGVSFATGNQTATAGSDYTAASGVLSWANGETGAKTFTVPILNDSVNEPAESLSLTLTNPTGGAQLGAATATLNIADDDPVQSLQLSSATYSIGEGGGSAVITVTRTGGTAGAVSVNYATSNGTATAGSDYTAASGTLNFANGQSSATFSVPIVNDTQVESSETVNLALSNPGGGATLGSPASSTLTIQVNNGQLQFSAATYSIGEGGGSAVITVTRTGGTAGAVSVNYATSNGTATAGSDYTNASGTLNFADGQSSATFSVPIVNDTQVESSETVNLTLSNPGGGATLGSPASSTLTIQDNDVNNGQLQFSAATYSIGEGGGSAVITVTRTGGTAGAVSVNYATSNGTATAGSDYTAASGTLNFADGQSSATFSVPIVNDTQVESSETVNLTLSNPGGGATLGSPATGTLTIQDNDVNNGQLQFSAATYSIGEGGGSAVITVTRTGGTVGAVSVTYATSNGTATAGSDYTAASGTLNFANGQTSATFSVPITNDTQAESNETINLSLTNPTGGAALGSPASAALTIQDNDSGNGQLLRFYYSTFNTKEDWGYVVVTVKRSGGAAGAVSVSYSTSNGTATAGADYNAASGVLNFAAGQTSKTFTVALINDNLHEPNETVNLMLSNPTGGAALGPQSTAVINIADDEITAPGTLQFDRAVYSTRENWGYAVIYVTRSAGTLGPVSVSYATSNGTAIAGQDYQAVSGVLNFATGETTKSFNVPLINDRIFESQESVNLLLSNATGGATIGARSTALLNIADDDPPPSAPQSSLASSAAPSSSDDQLVFLLAVDQVLNPRKSRLAAVGVLS